MAREPRPENGAARLTRRDLARSAAASLAMAACPGTAVLLAEPAPAAPVPDEEALRASAVFTMSR